MDPLSIVGLAGSLVGISQVIGKSLQGLVNLQSKYRTASLTVSLLIGQLTTLKAALNQISEWSQSVFFDAPQQELVLADLGVSLRSCGMLVGLLEDKIEQLDRSNADTLSVKGQIGFLWEEKGLGELTTHLNNQINALNLLLTALHWYISISLSLLRLADH